jgi:hypothetical protein
VVREIDHSIHECVRTIFAQVLLEDPCFSVDFRVEDNRFAVRSPGRRNVPTVRKRKPGWRRDARAICLKIRDINASVTGPLLKRNLFSVRRSRQISRAEPRVKRMQ